MQIRVTGRPLLASALATAIVCIASPGRSAEAPTATEAPTEPPTPTATEAPAEAAAADPPKQPPEDPLERDLAEELARQKARRAAEEAGAATGTAQSVAAGAPGSTAASRGLSNAFNPAASANGLLLGIASNRSGAQTDPELDDLGAGMFLQEIEVQFSSVVDPYLRADVTLNARSFEEVSFEQAYITTLELPSVNVRAGLFKATLGRHNILHTHAFPFITGPLPWRVMLGREGISDPGVSADVLLPLPFYTELTLQTFAGEWATFGAAEEAEEAPDALPDERRPGDFAYLGHLKTLFELGDPATVELGGTYLAGRNAFGGVSQLVGGDLTFKYRPLETERSFGVDWTTEYLWEDRADAPELPRRGGAYSAVRLQASRRVWLQVRGAILGVPEGEGGRATREEALVAFVPSEFSAFRVQYALEQPPDADPIQELFLQAIFNIGSHPAHAY